MLKNNKVKKRKRGSESGRVKNKSNLEFAKNPTPDDQTPKPALRLRENPGGAINSNKFDAQGYPEGHKGYEDLFEDSDGAIPKYFYTCFYLMFYGNRCRNTFSSFIGHNYLGCCRIKENET